MKLTRAMLSDEQYHKAPLWFVFPDFAGRPRALAGIVNTAQGRGRLTLWGFSVYQRKGAYRTIGQPLDEYIVGKDWHCYTTRAEMLEHPGIIVDAEKMPSDHWLATQVREGVLRAEKRPTAKTLTAEQYVEAARSAGLLAELCVLVDYDPDVGKVEEHWEPKYMHFARALFNTGGHRAA